MDDTATLASGYIVDQSYQQWFISQKNVCPFTGHSLSHSLTVPNHLLRDKIPAWCFDHSDLPPYTTADTLSSHSVPPSEEQQIQDILEKFSGHSGLQKEALHLIHLMSKASKGVQPCLGKWPGLVPVLLDVTKKWKSSWERDVEEERISLFLNLSMHRPNREILARQNELPAVLMEVVEKADRVGSSLSLLAMVASTVAILSEFDVFRKRLLDIGGMKMLRDLLKIEDVLVRKETATAILALCTDDKANSSAVDYDVTVRLLDSFMVTDESMTGLINPSHKKVQPIRLPREVATKWPHGNSLNQSYEQRCISQKDNCRPNEVAVKWSLDDDDGIPYPLYAEFCGETISSSQRREWTDVRLVWKLRRLRQQERLAARNHFKLRLRWSGTRRKSSSLFMVAMDKLNNEKQNDEYSEGCEVPEYLLCSLSCELMVDPVTIATGKTFERRALKDWFEKNGHICPVTGEFVSGTILRNDRVKGYLEEWAKAKFEGATKFSDGIMMS